MFSTSPQFYCKIPLVNGENRYEKNVSETGIDYIWSASEKLNEISHQNRNRNSDIYQRPFSLFLFF